MVAEYELVSVIIDWRLYEEKERTGVQKELAGTDFAKSKSIDPTKPGQNVSQTENKPSSYGTYASYLITHT